MFSLLVQGVFLGSLQDPDLFQIIDESQREMPSGI
mgnify:CR=1 FL=1